MRQAGGLVLAAALLAAPLAAQHPPAEPAGAELTIYLMTMGSGAEVWERFGHNAIVVEDRSSRQSTSYNYGMFSFRQENFLLRFIQGRMRYWMAGFPTADDVPRYEAAGRSVWLQELNLAPAERLAMRDFMEWNRQEENKYYHYDYYRDNCSTRVRDALDRVLGGALQAQTQGPAAGTYRFHTQRLTTDDIPIYTGLLLALGQGADAPRTRWEEMFLPFALRDYLRTVTVPGEGGHPVPLVGSERTLFESHAFPVRDTPPDWAPWYLLAGSVLGAALVVTGRLAGRGRVAGALFIGLGGGWALLTGTGGAILAGLWAFTDHAIAAGNENVLQLSLVALALGLTLPFAGRRPAVRRAAVVLALVVGGLSVMGLLLKLLPLFDQVNGQVLALTVPANVGLALGVRARFRPVPA